MMLDHPLPWEKPSEYVSEEAAEAEGRGFMAAMAMNKAMKG